MNYEREGNPWACFDYAAAFSDMVYTTYIAKTNKQGFLDIDVVANANNLTIAMFGYIKHMWTKEDEQVSEENLQHAAKYLEKLKSISAAFAKYFISYCELYNDDDAYMELMAYKEAHIQDITEMYTPKQAPVYKQSKFDLKHGGSHQKTGGDISTGGSIDGKFGFDDHVAGEDFEFDY